MTATPPSGSAGTEGVGAVAVVGETSNQVKLTLASPIANGSTLTFN